MQNVRTYAGVNPDSRRNPRHRRPTTPRHPRHQRRPPAKPHPRLMRHLHHLEARRLTNQAIDARPATFTANLERFPTQPAASLGQHIASLCFCATGVGNLGERDGALTPESSDCGTQKRGCRVNHQTRESSSTLMVRRCRRLPRILLPLLAAEDRLQCRCSGPRQMARSWSSWPRSHGCQTEIGKPHRQHTALPDATSFAMRLRSA
jgi:hypothetical protein